MLYIVAKNRRDAENAAARMKKKPGTWAYLASVEKVAHVTSLGRRNHVHVTADAPSRDDFRRIMDRLRRLGAAV